MELCENAGDAPGVESDELVEGVICEDIVNYSVMDSDGTMISTDGLVKECDTDSVEDIINSPYCLEGDNLVPQDAFNMYDFWDGIDYDEILKKNDQYFNRINGISIRYISHEISKRISFKISIHVNYIINVTYTYL